jgi:TatD DNase family protein
MKIIDTHTHDYFSAFDEDREEMIQRCREAGIVAKIQIGCDEVSSLAAVKLAQENDNFFATVGIHPTDIKNIGKELSFRTKGFENYVSEVENLDDLMNFFENLILKSRKKIVGIGECGFDFYHDRKEDFYEIQKEALLKQFQLAEKFNLPLIIHTRDADQELMSFFEKQVRTLGSPNLRFSRIRGVIHCFSGTLEMAKLFTEKYGFYLGIGGIITYNKSTELREIVEQISAKFLIVETDSPFLPPHQWRKKNSRNESTSLSEIVAKIAEVKNLEVPEMAKILEKNSRDLFRI